MKTKIGAESGWERGRKKIFAELKDPNTAPTRIRELIHPHADELKARLAAVEENPALDLFWLEDPETFGKALWRARSVVLQTDLFARMRTSSQKILVQWVLALLEKVQPVLPSGVSRTDWETWILALRDWLQNPTAARSKVSRHLDQIADMQDQLRGEDPEQEGPWRAYELVWQALNTAYTKEPAHWSAQNALGDFFRICPELRDKNTESALYWQARTQLSRWCTTRLTTLSQEVIGAKKSKKTQTASPLEEQLLLEAQDPNTEPDRLARLAQMYPREVWQNPVRQLLVLEDPAWWNKIVKRNTTFWLLHVLSENQLRRVMADLAEFVLPVYEKLGIPSKAPQEAIQAARDYANNTMDENELRRANLAVGMLWDKIAEKTNDFRPRAAASVAHAATMPSSGDLRQRAPRAIEYAHEALRPQEGGVDNCLQSSVSQHLFGDLLSSPETGGKVRGVKMRRQHTVGRATILSPRSTAVELDDLCEEREWDEGNAADEFVADFRAWEKENGIQVGAVPPKKKATRGKLLPSGSMPKRTLPASKPMGLLPSSSKRKK